MKTRRTIVAIGALPLLMGAAYAAEANTEVTKLLSQAKTQAFQIKEDALNMESFNRMAVSRETEAAAINQIRDHVNALVATENKLQAAKEDAAPWQRQVINRVVPFLDELEGYTSAVIEHLNGEVHHTPAEMKDYLEANADYSTDLAKMIADFVDYGQTKDRLERLQTTLEISTR